MLFEYIAGYINAFAFLLPPFKQYGGRYFIFFLILALGDPFAILIVSVTHLNPHRTVCVVAWSMFLSVLNPKYLKDNLILMIISTILVITASLLATGNVVQIITIIIDYLILIYFIRQAVVNYKINSSIHLGYFILILYMTGLILKWYLFNRNVHLVQVYFYLTDLFEILVAVFFTLYKVEDAPQVKLRQISA